jgi:hypothetical protein
MYSPRELHDLMTSWVDKLTPEEKWRFDKKLCINCGQPGHIRRNYPHPHPQKAQARISPPNGEVGGNVNITPSSIPDVPIPDIDPLDEHALKIAHYSEIISTTLRTLTGTTAGTSGVQEAAQSPMEGSRRADAECFAQMSTHFFVQMMATQSCKYRFLVAVQAMLQQQSCAYDRVHAEERRVNSPLFKDMIASFMLELKNGLTEKTSLHENAHASLEMQLELQKELKIYQAQVMEINELLGAYQDRAITTNTRFGQLLSQGPLHDQNNVQANHPGVSTETVQRTIRELVSTLTYEIIIRLEGPQTEFHTKLQLRLEGVLETIEKDFSDPARPLCR